MRHIGYCSHPRYLEGSRGGLSVSVGTFFQDGVGTSRAWSKTPRGSTPLSRWILGEAESAAQPPEFLLGAILPEALTLTGKHLRLTPNNPGFTVVVARN